MAEFFSRLAAVVDEKLETFRVFDRLRLPLIGLIALLGVAAVASPRLMEVFDRAVERTMHHDLAWTASMPAANCMTFSRR